MIGEKSVNNMAYFFDIRLICDIENMHFEILKNLIHKLTGQVLATSNIASLRNQNFESGTKNLLKICGLEKLPSFTENIEFVRSEFEKIKILIKPKLTTLDLIKKLLNVENNEIFIYCNYEDKITKFLESHVLPAFDNKKLQIISLSSTIEKIKNYKIQDIKNIVVLTSENLYEYFTPDLLKSTYFAMNNSKNRIKNYICLRIKRKMFAMRKTKGFS